MRTSIAWSVLKGGVFERHMFYNFLYVSLPTDISRDCQEELVCPWL